MSFYVAFICKATVYVAVWQGRIRRGRNGFLGYPAVSKDTVMVTSMKADFFEKKVGVPGVALDIPVCTKAE